MKLVVVRQLTDNYLDGYLCIDDQGEYYNIDLYNQAPWFKEVALKPGTEIVYRNNIYFINMENYSTNGTYT